MVALTAPLTMLIWVDMLVPTTTKPSSAGSSGLAVAPLWLLTTTLSVTVSSVVMAVRSTLAESGLCATAASGMAQIASTVRASRFNFHIGFLILFVMIHPPDLCPSARSMAGPDTPWRVPTMFSVGGTVGTRHVVSE